MKIILLVSLIIGMHASAEDIVNLSSLTELKNASSLEKIEGNILVYFWASWCPDCREKLGGALGKLQTELPGVHVLTVNTDREESKGLGFIESEKISLPVYRDKERALSKALKLFAVPAWAVLKKGKEGWKVLMSSTGSDLATIKQQLQR